MATVQPDGTTPNGTTSDVTASNNKQKGSKAAVVAPVDELAPPLRADSSLDSAIAAFDEYMVRKGFSENTIKAFRNDLKITQDFLGGETKLHQINSQHLYDFLDWLQHDRGKPCSAKSLARRITTIKVFFGWIYGIGVIGNDPAEPILQQPAKTPLPIVLSDRDVNQLVLAAQGYLLDRDKPDARPFLLVNLLLQTGMKKAECARLLISDLDATDPNAPEVTIRYPEERHAHKNRTIPLSANLVPALNDYLKEYKPENFLFECTPRNLEYVLDEVGRKAEIEHTQVGFETLRWSSAVRDFRRGVPEDRLRQKMGLSKISWRETREKILKLTGQEPRK